MKARSMRSLVGLGAAMLLVMTGSTLTTRAQDAPTASGGPQDPSLYRLPVEAGLAVLVTQGNDTADLGGDHAGLSQYAYDFETDDGSSFPVVASRAGIVEDVRSEVPDGNCPETGGDATPSCWTDANYVVIDHLDGTAGLYLHLAQASSADLVAGQQVVQGQPLGTAGMSGWTDRVRLHFMIMMDESVGPDGPAWWRQSLGPIGFADDSVRDVHPDGVPGAGLDVDGPFTSGNEGPVEASSGGRPLARPPELPGRLPWAAGTSHTVRRGSDPGALDGYGFDVVSGDRGDAIDEATEVFPLFGGTVRFAGCATGASAPLGRVIVIERPVGAHLYQAIYSHLSSVAPSLSTEVGANEAIGTFGSTETSVDGSCDGTAGTTRLHVSVLRDAEVTSTGEIIGGRPVEPWPLLGAGIYEPTSWWQGPMEAMDVGEDGEVPTVTWAPTTTSDAAHVPYGRPVDLAIDARDDGGLREVRVMAMHESWPQRQPGRFRGLQAAKTWRILAICRPAGVTGIPGQTRDCEWDGDDRDAVVTYRWQPTQPQQQGSAPWLPPANAAIDRRADRCVPVTLAFEVVDDSGHLLTPERGKVAQRCDATASGLGRTVYLEPLDAPASPTAARVRCTRRPEIRVYCLRDVLSWEHPAAAEAGFRIYLDSVTWIAGRNGPCRYESQKGPWLLATVADGTTKWTVDYDELNTVVQSAIGSRSRYATTHKLSVAAFDPGGRSPRRKASGAVDNFHDDIPCNTDSLDGYGGA